MARRAQSGPRGPSRHGREESVEPEDLRRGVRGADLAEGVRRRRRLVRGAGDPARGVGARRGADPPRGDRPRHGRADDHRARDGGAEAALPREHPLRRGDLVPGILRAGRGLDLSAATDERRAPRRPLRRLGAEDLVVVRAHRGLVHPRHALRPGVTAPRGPHVHGRRHALAGRRGAADPPHHGRRGLQRDLLRERRGARRERPRRDRQRLGGRDDDAPPRRSGARASPSPAPAPIWPAREHAPSSRTATTSSTGRRSRRRRAHRRLVLLVTRSDPDSQRHAGLTYIIVDMRSPGVECGHCGRSRGDAAFNEIFFTDVECRSRTSSTRSATAGRSR